MAFTMRDEWKDEPVSTTGATYVEPSATDPIKPGQRVAHLFPRAVMEEYVRPTTWPGWIYPELPNLCGLAGQELLTSQ